VRLGYKQTDVGVIPEEWKCESISSVARLESGHTPSKRKPSYWGGSVPWISLHDTARLDGRDITETAKTITEEGLANSSARLLPPGTVVFSRTATVGKSTVMARSMATSQDFANYICGSDLHNDYLVYLFRGMGRTWQRLMAGSIHNTIYMPVFKALQIALPPLPEQRAIAAALRSVDDLLDGLTRLIAKKRALKRAAMQQLLTGRTRLPGFHGEWEATTLGAIGECIIGLTYKPENVVAHGLLVFRSSNIQNGRLAYDDNVYVNLKVSEHLYTREGDILVCVRNGSRALIGKCAVIDERATGETFGAFMSVYRTKHWRFILHVFQADDIQRQIRDNIGATINQITNKDLKGFRLKLPPEDEQTAIAAVLFDMDAELEALEARRDKTRSLKQAMMQDLLTGKTRLVTRTRTAETIC
jgi:type I restriction enzyme, S subunit